MPHEITAPDGRTIVVHEDGPPDGHVVLVHNGTPSSGLLYEPHVEEAARRGARMISINRPGYAGSTRLPGRDVAAVVPDARTVLDALEVERCVTLGASGGGPHALACAALLPDRVAAAATLAGVGPYGVDGFDFLAGMGEQNVEEFELALEGEEPLRVYLEQQASDLAGVDTEQVGEELASILSDVDRECLSRDVSDYFVRSLHDSLSHGVDGWLDDSLAFAKPWGFDLAAIAVPVLLWQGEHDLMVPAAHGRWLAEHIPGVEARISAEEGHLTLHERHMGDTLDWLMAAL